MIRFLVSWRGRSTRRIVRDGPAASVRGRWVPGRRVVSAPEASGRSGRTTRDVGLPYLPGLDGLRALAVIVVLLYHADLPWLPGGFLGVEVFFVISGYLITALLVAEWRQHGRIDLKAFWFRRARRLLPALYLLLAVTLAYAVVFLPEEVAGLRGDVIAALGYVTNWYLVFGHESYFEAIGRPSLLKHLWSLAVEEQFYLLWPPVLAVGLSMGARRWRERRVLLVALSGAAASAVLMGALYRPEADPSRLYFGTDTRATGLLMGAALALVWTPWLVWTSAERGGSLATRRWSQLQSQLRRRWGWTVPLLLDVGGLAALGVLAVACLHLGEFEPLLYRGGLALVALATTVVIMTCAHPHTRLGVSLLGWRPLRWIGVRSYGIYLWHWPVFMVTRPQLDVSLEGMPLVVLRLALTVLVAELSYRYVETPIRKGVLGRAWRALGEAGRFRRRRLSVLWAGAAVPIVALCAVLGVAVARAQPPEPPSYISTKEIHSKGPSDTSGAATIETTRSHARGALIAARADAGATKPETAAEGSSTGTQDQKPRASEETATVKDKTASAGAAAGAPVGPVSAIGDSSCSALPTSSIETSTPSR